MVECTTLLKNSLEDIMDELSHQAELSDWNFCQFTNQTLKTGLAINGKRVGDHLVQPGEQLKLKVKMKLFMLASDRVNLYQCYIKIPKN